jgi:hypothetical protein
MHSAIINQLHPIPRSPEMKPILAIACALVASHAVSHSTASPAAMSGDSLFTIDIDHNESQADRATLTEIIGATLQVVSSDTFAKLLASVEQQNLWLNEDGSTMRAGEVAEVYLGRHPVMGPMPAVVRVYKGFLFAGKYPATGLTKYPPITATITLKKRELRRWRNATRTSRSCVVNTLAHELTHTVARSAQDGTYVFWDEGHGKHENEPFASYVVGSVAQCAMLERENAMEGSFAACVKYWGINFTNGTGCD